MSVFKQSKPVALLGALACTFFMFGAVTASAADEDSMSHDQKMSQGDSMKSDSMSKDNAMQDNKAADGHTQGMSHDDSMSKDESMKKDSMSGGEGGVPQGDSMNKEDNM